MTLTNSHLITSSRAVMAAGTLGTQLQPVLAAIRKKEVLTGGNI